MAEIGFPFEDVDTTEAQFSNWARHIGEGVYGVPGDAELEIYADSTGLLVKVPTGQAMIRGHYYTNTSVVTLTLDTADGSFSRKDAIVLELDPTANTILAKTIAGIPASSPVLPSLTQTESGVYQLLLAEVLVGVGVTTINAGDVTDRRTFLGYKFGVWTTTDRPASPVTGQCGLNVTLGHPEYYDGSNWEPLIIASVNAALIDHLLTTLSTSRAIIADDNGKMLRATNSSAITVTVNDVLTDGQRIDFVRDGSGDLQFEAGAGVTLGAVGSTGITFKVNTRYSAATVVRVASGEYRLIGNVGAA